MPPHDFEADDRNAARAKFDYLRQERAKMLEEDAQKKKERSNDSIFHDLNAALEEIGDAVTTFAMLHPVFCSIPTIICLGVAVGSVVAAAKLQQPRFIGLAMIIVVPAALFALPFVDGLMWRHRIKKRNDAVADRG